MSGIVHGRCVRTGDEPRQYREVFQPGSRVESINQACGYTKIRKETSFLRGRSSCAKKSPVKAGLGRTGNQPIIFLEPPL